MKKKVLTYTNPFIVNADPFVYRWLGEYYLFGTGSYCPVYKSQDLINWTYFGTAIEPDEENIDIQGCYAPEVVYFGGLFYIIYSPKGNEHRIYCSKNVASGYTALDNIFEGIDGSFFVEKQGVTLFRSGDVKNVNKEGIYYSTKPTVKDFNREDWKRIPLAYLNGWTEGPFLVERKDFKYLTFTGNHYLSEGYRINYISGKGEDYSNYNYGNTLIISTEKEYNGLGHSATVIGPNLDSFIITYHNLAVGKGKRHYNFSTIITDGKRMFVNGLCNYPSPLPLKADFECKDKEWLKLENDKLIIPQEIKGVFTAELSFKKADQNTIYFGDNKLVLSGDNASLYTDKAVKVGAFTPIPNDAVCVVRIVCDGLLKVYINSQEVFNTTANVFGFVGYDNNTIPLYSALTLDAFGSSDKKLIKNIPSKFPANCCLNEQETLCDNGINYILPKGATYDINVGFSGKYYVVINTKSLKGGEITLNINKKAYTFVVPEGNRKWFTTSIKLSKGFKTLKVNSSDVYISDIKFVLQDKASAKLKKLEDLTQIFNEKGLAVERGELKYAHTKNKTFDGKVNFYVENTKNYCGGITLRENYFAHYNHHPAESFYGYLVAIYDSKLHFYKTSYEKVLLCEFPVENGKISVEFNKNKFKFYNEGNLLGSYVDNVPHFYGHIGVLALKGLYLHYINLEKIKE